jgi:hypothetical protein
MFESDQVTVLPLAMEVCLQARYSEAGHMRSAMPLIQS